MVSKHVVFAIVVAGGILAACASRGGISNVIPPGNSVTLPAFDPDIAMTVVMPKNTVGEEKPDEGLGTYKSPYWHATLGGYTQQSYSQALSFPPGTKITLKNLSKTTPHTLNVVAKILGPPAKFPAHPNLQTTKAGNGILGTGYRSGIIQPGKSVTITLSKAGIYLIGCAFHYSQGMHDVFNVKKGGKPGQQGTPPPKGTATPSSGPSPTGYGG